MSDGIPQVKDEDLLPLLIRYFDLSEALRQARALKHLCLRPRKDKAKIAKVNDEMMLASAELSNLAEKLEPCLHGTANWKAVLLGKVLKP